ncbi:MULTISPECIES: type VI secretion system lipoprotein TssJ [unclassified Pseudomonas]|uniref:type VI secretion system lipoprotein TssJ n=1 Tax=unclassified Pseudomonas TaxID=196821 RepID=UPI0015A48AD7|nr:MULTISPECIES: type VI secretion system lipoprotein TssJ [unclassified Pseudomonas]NWC93027.1 type VI secretion system lipoprotein TssJ [Pseudomonas sp. IPO3779]NWD19445.1 type VI secretion system lipoprotein TssJ [Pseudomonas sp. IPO3778]
MDKKQKPALAIGVAALVMTAMLTGCGVTDRIGKRADDTWMGDMFYSDNEKVILSTYAGNQLNLDANGKPLSVVLHVYQLSSLERFAAVSADDLSAAPQKALGNTLIEEREIVLLPGMGQTDTWPLNKAARYVAVAGFFRSDEDSQWKIAFDANSLRKDGIWFSSDGVRVLADFYSVQAVRGMDVLNTPKGQEPAAVANPPAAPVIPKPISDMAQQQATDMASGAVKKTADTQMNSLLEGAK